MVFGDHELDATEPTRPQALEEGRPEGPDLGVADLDDEHLPVACDRDPGGHHDGPGDDPTFHPALHSGGVAEHVDELGVAQRPGPERFEVLVERGTDPADLGLGDPQAAPTALTRSSTLRVETPCT